MLFRSPFPITRGFIMLTAIGMMVVLWWLLTRTRIGLIIQAALTHPETVETLGHNVPRVFMLVFALGTGLAGLAGVIGGVTFITEPAMAATVGSVIFVVVVVGGLGSIPGAFLASLFIGVTKALCAWAGTLHVFGIELAMSKLTLVVEFIIMALVLMIRPWGLMGKALTSPRLLHRPETAPTPLKRSQSFLIVIAMVVA